MSDTAHRAKGRSRSIAARGALVSAIVALALAGVPAAARADGDPASDVLLTQGLFVPWDAGATAAGAAQLESIVAAADRRGYPARVALIASASDLGSVTQLWRQPQNYAEFLGIELSLAFHGAIIVVMPNGEGVYRSGLAATAAQAALAHVQRHAGRGNLVAAAAAAVERLAAADGHALPSSAERTPGRRAPRAAPTDVTAWAAFAVGGALVALAWAASLRARPLRRPRRPSLTARG